MSKRVYGLKHATPKMKYHHMNFVLEWRAGLKEKQEEERARKHTMQVMDVCHEIRDNLTQEEYNAWWEAAPEDTFFSAACDKLLDMKLNSGADLIDVYNWSDIFLSPEYQDALAFGEAFDFEKITEVKP